MDVVDHNNKSVNHHALICDQEPQTQQSAFRITGQKTEVVWSKPHFIQLLNSSCWCNSYSAYNSFKTNTNNGVKDGQILKIENVISIPHLKNKALIYYSNGQPFKIFWAFTKSPYLVIFVFYYFDGKNISDYLWENFKTFSPFEYQRAVDLIGDFQKKGN
jgi:hypothetical protein